MFLLSFYNSRNTLFGEEPSGSDLSPHRSPLEEAFRPRVSLLHRLTHDFLTRAEEAVSNRVTCHSETSKYGTFLGLDR